MTRVSRPRARRLRRLVRWVDNYTLDVFNPHRPYQQRAPRA
jgi:hypothetical protein